MRDASEASKCCASSMTDGRRARLSIEKRKSGKFAVYDLGGGTFNIGLVD
jgi:hypothetical protein